jgi:hypothetical protein
MSQDAHVNAPIPPDFEEVSENESIHLSSEDMPEPPGIEEGSQTETSHDGNISDEPSDPPSITTFQGEKIATDSNGIPGPPDDSVDDSGETTNVIAATSGSDSIPAPPEF